MHGRPVEAESSSPAAVSQMVGRRGQPHGPCLHPRCLFPGEPRRSCGKRAGRRRSTESLTFGTGVKGGSKAQSFDTSSCALHPSADSLLGVFGLKSRLTRRAPLLFAARACVHLSPMCSGPFLCSQGPLLSKSSISFVPSVRYLKKSPIISNFLCSGDG